MLRRSPLGLPQISGECRGFRVDAAAIELETCHQLQRRIVVSPEIGKRICGNRGVYIARRGSYLTLLFSHIRIDAKTSRNISGVSTPVLVL